MTQLLLRSITILYILHTFGCATPTRPSVDPHWGAHIYAGDPFKGGVVRSQDQELVMCIEPRFQEFRCVPSQDLDRLFLLLRQCRDLREIYETDQVLK